MAVVEPTEALQEFGASMRRNRVLLGYSVREAAERAGISKNTILRIETGLPVQRATRQKLCRAYGCVPTDPEDRRAPQHQGKHFKLQTRDEAVWYATRIGADGQAEAYTNDRVQSPNERNRLGWNRLANHFGQPFRVRREGSRFIPFLVEVFAPTDTTADLSGERFILGIRGVVRVVVGEESFLVGEGEAASYDATLPNRLEPAEPIKRGEPAPLVLQIVIP